MKTFGSRSISSHKAWEIASRIVILAMAASLFFHVDMLEQFFGRRFGAGFGKLDRFSHFRFGLVILLIQFGFAWQSRS